MDFAPSLTALETALTAIESELPPVLSSLPRAPALPPLESARLHRGLITSGLLLATAFLRLSGAHTEKHAMLVEEMDRLKVLSMRLRTVAAMSHAEAEGAAAAAAGAVGAPPPPARERGPTLTLDGSAARRVDGEAAGRFVRAALAAPVEAAAGAAGKRPREGHA